MEFRELYERYYTDVYRFALFLTGNVARAEDLTADTFVRAWTASMMVSALITTSMPRERASAIRATTCSSSASSFDSPSLSRTSVPS